MDRPNIIFMHSHNTGTHIQPYGHAVPTPNLQRLAEQGVLFRHAFAAAPTCSPSRASFLTGLCPHSAGTLGLAHRGFGHDHYPQHITHRLASVGYHTAHCGVEHIAPRVNGVDTYHGYQQEIGPMRGDAAQAGPVVAAFLMDAPKQPFFLSVGIRETHTPFPDPDPVNHPAEDERYCTPPTPLPNAPQTRRDIAAFKASARAMDKAYGQILDALDRAKLTDNTVVFCFADHGLQLPLNMCNLTDHGLGVYLIARGPGGFTGGKVVDAMVSLLDLVPTSCALAGVAHVEPAHGKSLLPLVNGKLDTLHEELFGEVTFHAAYEPMRSVRTKRYKYIRRYDGRDKPVLPNTDHNASRDYLLDQGWMDQPREQELLFDLAFDPQEQNNLARRADMAGTLETMRGRLDRWMRETNDPLHPDGKVTPPSGAKFNDPDSLTYEEPTQSAP